MRDSNKSDTTRVHVIIRATLHGRHLHHRRAHVHGTIRWVPDETKPWVEKRAFLWQVVSPSFCWGKQRIHKRTSLLGHLCARKLRLKVVVWNASKSFAFTCAHGRRVGTAVKKDCTCFFCNRRKNLLPAGIFAIEFKEIFPCYLTRTQIVPT